MTIEAQDWRKKPVTIQAVQFHVGEHTKREWMQWCPAANIGTPGATEDDSLDSTDFRWFNITTLEGTSYEVPDGAWVIKGVKGEFYPCQADIFEATYEQP